MGHDEYPFDARSEHSRVLTVELPLTRFFQDGNISVIDQTVTAVLDLSAGPGVYKSEPIEVGTFKGLPMQAMVRFSYDYDNVEGKLTIRGNDDKTTDQLSITTFLGGASGQVPGVDASLVYFHTPNDVGQNHPFLNMWADHVARQFNFADAMVATARSCNDAITSAAIEAGLSSVLKIGTPPLVTLDNIDDFKLMFGERISDELPADRIAQVIQIQAIVDSTFVGTVVWQLNKTFANVDGSTHDPKPSGTTSWIELWRNKCNGGANTSKCSSYNSFSLNTTWKCTSELVGGHVITGTTAVKKKKGDTVYIFPICSRHNGSDPNYMKSLYNPEGVQLNYWQ
jgi:hypothetical protein